MTNKAITISDLNEEHIPQILEIDQLSFPRFENESFFRRENKKCLVARQEATVVGYLVYEKVLDEVHILRFAVHPHFRRKGVGKSLLKEVFPWGQRFFLETRRSNIPSQKLCESLGFKVVGQRKQYYQDNNEDALILQKMIFWGK